MQDITGCKVKIFGNRKVRQIWR